MPTVARRSRDQRLILLGRTRDRNWTKQVSAEGERLLVGRYGDPVGVSIDWAEYGRMRDAGHLFTRREQRLSPPRPARTAGHRSDARSGGQMAVEWNDPPRPEHSGGPPGGPTCPRCAATAPDAARFCGRCGNPLAMPALNAPAPAPWGRWAAGIGAALAVLAALLAVAG